MAAMFGAWLRKIIEIGYRKTAPQPKKGKQDGGKSPPAVTQGRTSAKLVKGKKSI
jgi:hypothetical protein